MAWNESWFVHFDHFLQGRYTCLLEYRPFGTILAPRFEADRFETSFTEFLLIDAYLQFLLWIAVEIERLPASKCHRMEQEMPNTCMAARKPCKCISFFYPSMISCTFSYFTYLNDFHVCLIGRSRRVQICLKWLNRTKMPILSKKISARYSFLQHILNLSTILLRDDGGIWTPK